MFMEVTAPGWNLLVKKGAISALHLYIHLLVFHFTFLFNYTVDTPLIFKYLSFCFVQIFTYKWITILYTDELHLCITSSDISNLFNL